MKATTAIDVDLIINSPNFDERPDGMRIDTIVIHAISLPPDQFGGDFVEQLFTNQLDGSAHPYFCEICHLEVSAHFYIKRGGSLIQFVSPDKRAWHAGQSEFLGKQQVNDFSVGIELEGCDAKPFTEAQYRSLTNLTKQLLQSYPHTSVDRIVGHSDISPGRKTDPGPCFDWKRYRRGLPA